MASFEEIVPDIDKVSCVHRALRWTGFKAAAASWATPLHQRKTLFRVRPNILGKAIRIKLNVACLYWRVERGRSQGGGANGLRWARGFPPPANGGDNVIRGDADDAALCQSPPEAA